MPRSGAFCPRCGDAVPEEPTDRPVAVESGDESGSHESGSHESSSDESGSDESRSEPVSADDEVLCTACYFEQFDLVDAPDRVQVRTCAQCGAVHQGNRWVDVGAEDYTDVAVEAVTEALGVHLDATDVSWGVRPEQVDETTIRMHAEFSGVVRGEPVSEAVTVPVKIARETCSRCGKIAGGSFGAILQVRGDGRTPTDEEAERAQAVTETVVEEMAATGDRDAFVTSVDQGPEGPTIKVSTPKIGDKAARRIVAELGGDYDASERLITEDEDGQPVYRMAYAIRLPRFKPGDVLDPDDGDGPVLVRSAKGTVTGVRLATGEDYVAPTDVDLTEAATHLGHRDEASETTLVAVTDDHAVQVLDPETYESRSVPRPSFLDPDAETVPVLAHDEGLHVLPAADDEPADE